MALTGRREMELEIKDPKKVGRTSTMVASSKDACYKFLDTYIKFLTNIWVSIGVILLFIGYLALSTYVRLYSNKNAIKSFGIYCEHLTDI